MTDPGRHEPETLRPPPGELDGQLQLWTPSGLVQTLPRCPDHEPDAPDTPG